MDDCDGPLVEVFLVVILVFNGGHVDKVPQIRTRVPAYIVGVNVDFP